MTAAFLPSRPAMAGVCLGLMALFVILDLGVSAPIDPFAVPPPTAFGSGVAAGGAHCAAPPG